MTKHFTITVIIYLTAYSSKELLNVYYLNLIGPVVKRFTKILYTKICTNGYTVYRTQQNRLV